MSGTKELVTERLRIRKHVMEDAGVLYKNFGLDPDMYKYSGWNPYATPEMAEKTVAGFIENYSDPHFYGWAIEKDGKLIGVIGAYDYKSKKNSIEVGMSIEKASWGHGYASEALEEVLRFLTEDEKIDTVTAWCEEENAGSEKAMLKCGMKQTGMDGNRHIFAYSRDVIGEYISVQDTDIQEMLCSVRKVIAEAIPDATEKISYQMPTWYRKHNLIHFAAQKKHLGLYPGPEAVEHFEDELKERGLKYSKGAIQFPYNKVDLKLIRRIAEYCGSEE